MMRRLPFISALVLSLVVATAGSASAAPSLEFDDLDPGGQPTLTETLPVNVVFIGYEISESTFSAGLAVALLKSTVDFVAGFI